MTPTHRSNALIGRGTSKEHPTHSQAACFAFQWGLEASTFSGLRNPVDEVEEVLFVLVRKLEELIQRSKEGLEVYLAARGLDRGGLKAVRLVAETRARKQLASRCLGQHQPLYHFHSTSSPWP